MTRQYLVDNSAWARLGNPLLSAERKAEIAGWAESAQLWASGLLQLEAGYSAKRADDHAALMSRFARLDHAAVDEACLQRAVDLQSQLAQSGHHRVAPPDLVTAALAERYELTILHYDKDFDIILDRTDCVAPAEWVAPRGSL